MPGTDAQLTTPDPPAPKLRRQNRRVTYTDLRSHRQREIQSQSCNRDSSIIVLATSLTGLPADAAVLMRHNDRRFGFIAMLSAGPTAFGAFHNATREEFSI